MNDNGKAAMKSKKDNDTWNTNSVYPTIKVGSKEMLQSCKAIYVRQSDGSLRKQ